jgi:aminomethyltransferase
MTGTIQIAELRHTPLYAWHASHGARLVDFAGWAMPVQYASIVAEHRSTREAVTLFDVSHMGRIRFEGPGAVAFLDRLLTRRVSDMATGAVRYSLITADDGGILDDVLIYRLASAEAGEYCQLVVNASNRQRILSWIDAYASVGADVSWTDCTHESAMIAVQGPRAAELLAPLANGPLTDMKYYTARPLAIAGVKLLASRTGYTGEDGWELIVPAEAALALWQQLLDKGQPLGAAPAGLGARDTLRLEAGMPLYGHELSEQIDPFQAGLRFAVDLEGRSFPGHDALARRRDERSSLRRVGLLPSGARVPREGYAVLAGDRRVGTVTSGTHSPTLDRPIAMAYVEAALAEPGTELAIDIRGRSEPAQVVKLPFYRRK